MGDLPDVCRHCGNRIIRIGGPSGPEWIHQPAGASFLDNTHTYCHITAAEPLPHEDDDRRPHSKACGWQAHDHGSACSTNCPTCHGLPDTEPVAQPEAEGFTVTCAMCGEPLDQPGALLFSPPAGDAVRKMHLDIDCYTEVLALMGANNE